MPTMAAPRSSRSWSRGRRAAPIRCRSSAAPASATSNTWRRVQPLSRPRLCARRSSGSAGLPPPPASEVVSGDPWHYRLRTQVHTEVDPVTGGVRIGYHARGTNDVPLTRCPLLVPELEALLADLPAFLGDEPPKRLDLAAGEPGAPSPWRPWSPASPPARCRSPSATSPTATTRAPSFRDTAGCCPVWSRPSSARGRGRPPTISTLASASSLSRSPAATAGSSP